MAKCLFMHFGFYGGYADGIPCAVTVFVHEVSLLCMYFGAAHLCELFKQVALFLGEVHGQHYFEAREEVAVAVTAQARHAFPRQAEGAAILRFWRDGEHEFAPIW